MIPGRARADLRVGDAERDAAASMLGEHFVAGRLTKDEYDERTAAAWSARTVGELRVLFGDLPAVPPPAPVTPRPPQRSGRRAEEVVARLRVFPLFVVLLLVAALTQAWWLVLAAFVWVWWGGLHQARRRLRRYRGLGCRQPGRTGSDWVR